MAKVLAFIILNFYSSSLSKLNDDKMPVEFEDNDT